MKSDERSAQTGRGGRAASLLRDYLVSRPEYRRRWQEQAQRSRSEGISQAGVARVIARHLWSSGARPDSETTLPRDLKDRVRRGLAGQNLTPETLGWFIEAFGMDDRDERSLWATYGGDCGQLAGIRTIAVFERYRVSADQRLAQRRTLRTIMALEDGVDGCPFDHEPALEHIEVIHGGAVGQHGIVLERTLQKGETAALEYSVSYPGRGGAVTQVRPPVHGRPENIDIAVQFHATALPREISWAVWPDDENADPVAQELVAPNAHGAVHRFVPVTEEAIIGFRWEW